jgi:drug/metabolite transporter (DMT)-like permease
MGGALVRLTRDIDSWQIIFYRSLTVLACMGLLLMVTHGRRTFMAVKAAGTNAVIAGIAVAIAGLTFIMSLFYTTVAQAIFMVGIAPFMSAILGLWILRERIPQTTWIAMIIALAGMGVILTGNGAGDGSIIGTMLAVYSAFAFSCYAVLLRWGQRTDMSIALVWNALFLIMFALLMLLVPTGIRTNTGFGELNIGLNNLMICIIMGAIQLTLGLMLFTWGSRSVPAAQLSLIALVEPVLSPLWAWLAAKELPPVLTFVGGAIILAAIVFQTLANSRQKSLRPGSAMPHEIVVDPTGQLPHSGKHGIGIPHNPVVSPGSKRRLQRSDVGRH